MHVMLERDYDQPLRCLIQVDDAYLGGERTGCKPGRGAAAKTRQWRQPRTVVQPALNSLS